MLTILIDSGKNKINFIYIYIYIRDSSDVRSCQQNPGLSDIERAHRYGTSGSTGRRMRVKAGFKSYKAIKVPNRKDKQSEVVKTRARTLHDDVLTKHVGCLMMDGETPLKADFKQLAGPKHYTAKKRLGV